MALAALAIGAPSAAASTGPCSYDAPKGDKRSEARPIAGDRFQEVEESYSGRRHVTTCNRDGSLILSEEFFTITFAAGRTEEVLTSATRPVGENRFQYLEHFYPGYLATPGGADATSSDPRGEDDSCTNTSYSFMTSPSTAWKNQFYNYYANVDSMPGGDNTRQEITKGHHSWDYTNAGCGYNDITDLVSDYIGGTSARARPDTTDGINVRDFGSLSSGGWNSKDSAIASASYWYYLDANGTYYILESDTRFEYPASFDGKTYAWSTDGSPASNELDVYSVAAHESGHNIGLGHANSTGWLTMAPTYYTGTLNQRTLGKGDVLGMRALYP